MGTRLGGSNNVGARGAVLLGVEAAKDQIPNGKVVDGPCGLHHAAAKVHARSSRQTDDGAGDEADLGHLVVGRVETSREHLDEQLGVSEPRGHSGQGYRVGKNQVLFQAARGGRVLPGFHCFGDRDRRGRRHGCCCCCCAMRNGQLVSNLLLITAYLLRLFYSWCACKGWAVADGQWQWPRLMIH